MPSTAFNGFPYPALPQQANVPTDMQALAEQIETKMPRGRLTTAIRSSQAGPVAASAGWVAITGLTQSLTLATARKLDLIFVGQVTSNLAGTIVGCRIWNATTSGGIEQTTQIPVDNYGMPMPIFVSDVLAAGTYTFQVQMRQYGGPGDAFLTAVPAAFTINDVGAG